MASPLKQLRPGHIEFLDDDEDMGTPKVNFDEEAFAKEALANLGLQVEQVAGDGSWLG